MQAVGQLFAHGASQADVDIADIPFPQHLLGQSVGQLDAQLYAQRRVDGVGAEGGVGGCVVIIAVVAQQRADAATFVLQAADAERHAATDDGLVGGRVDEVAQRLGVSHVCHAVEGEERVQMDGVCQLPLLRVPRCHGLVADVAAEVAVVAEYRLCHRGAQRGVDLAHQHRRLAE